MKNNLNEKSEKEILSLKSLTDYMGHCHAVTTSLKSDAPLDQFFYLYTNLVANKDIYKPILDADFKKGVEELFK